MCKGMRNGEVRERDGFEIVVDEQDEEEDRSDREEVSHAIEWVAR